MNATEYLVVCRATGDASTVSPCQTGFGPQIIQGYVIDPANNGYYDQITQPLDTTAAVGFWTASFVFTLGLYFAVKGIGYVIGMIRSA